MHGNLIWLGASPIGYNKQSLLLKRWKGEAGGKFVGYNEITSLFIYNEIKFKDLFLNSNQILTDLRLNIKNRKV